MKNGKHVKLGTHNNVRITTGTINFKEFNSVYLNLSSWIEPKFDEDFNTLSRNLRTKIKSFLYSYENDFFNPNTIVDVDIKHKGMCKKKRSFMSIDITLFINNSSLTFKHIISNKHIHNLSNNIIDEIIMKKDNLNFFQRKNI